MGDGLTLPDLLAELARNGLRVASVTMSGGSVASFTAVPMESAPPAARAEGDDEVTQPETPDALEAFVNRKGLRR